MIIYGVTHRRDAGDYGWSWELDEEQLFTTREAAEKAMEPDLVRQLAYWYKQEQQRYARLAAGDREQAALVAAGLRSPAPPPTHGPARPPAPDYEVAEYDVHE